MNDFAQAPAVEPDPRFKPLTAADFQVTVRRLAPAEHAARMLARLGETFICSVCREVRPVIDHGLRKWPLPGGICHTCDRRHGIAWGRGHHTSKYSMRTDFPALRAVAVLTRAIIEECRHGQHHQPQ